ncbi:hypothetical protein EG68_02479 [Paragonimus skrjabini miyazakii]|uniref:Ig-like domain-containing protein n=1 Tax=Paragonimus skrjabini miyazakii TaxID=59628 RepID=A0A8S9Z044_9TREM|nr:hypothetical protein EG68_02479 [Paragonimus skrjabini miyazakii]
MNFPLLLPSLNEVYGTRGGAVITSAIYLHLLITAALMPQNSVDPDGRKEFSKPKGKKSEALAVVYNTNRLHRRLLRKARRSPDDTELIVNSTLVSMSQKLQLSVEPNQVMIDRNQSILLRCMLPEPPNAIDSVYVIWRFRHSTRPPPPANWAFMHQQDDLVRCPDPPKKCEFVNQYATALFRSPPEKSVIIHSLINTSEDQRIQRFNSSLLNIPYSESESFDVVESKPHNLYCLVSEANPKPIVTWFIYRHATEDKYKLLSYVPSDYTSTTWQPFAEYLDVQQTTALSHSDNGAFLECHAANSAGQVTSKPVKLRVSFIPIIKPFSPSVLHVLENTALVQSCSVLANPQAHVHWSDQYGRVISNSTTLYIPQVRRSSTKGLTCIATNPIGESRQELHYEVLYPPDVRVPPHVIANEGEKLEVACSADANPPVDHVYWTYISRDSDKNEEWSNGQRIFEGATLLIENVGRLNQGFYSCYAESTQVMPKLFTNDEYRNNQSLISWWQSKADRPATVKLTVRSPGFPSAVLYWFKYSLSEAEIQFSAMTSINWSQVMINSFPSNSSTLTIHKPDLMDSGIYGCYARNPMGSGPPSYEPISIEGRPFFLHHYPDEFIYLVTDLQSVDREEKSTLNRKQLNESHGQANQAQLIISPPAKLSDFTMNCTFLSNPQASVSWFYKPTHTDTAASEWFKLKPSGLRNNAEANAEIQLKTKPLKLFGVLNVFYTVSTLIIPAFPSAYVFNDLINTWHLESQIRCDDEAQQARYYLPSQNPMYIWLRLAQLHQMESSYRYEISNIFGNTVKSSKVVLKHRPLAIPAPDDTLVHKQAGQPGLEGKRGKNVGPMLCQFFARPPVIEIQWWRQTDKGSKLLHKTQTLTDTAQLESNEDAIIISGSPALKPQAFNSNSKSADHLFTSIWNSVNTVYSGMWVRAEEHAEETSYICVAVNEVGNSSQKWNIKYPSGPSKIEAVRFLNTSFTSAVFTWRPGFHSTNLKSALDNSTWFSFVKRAGSRQIHARLQTFFQNWESESYCAQKFVIELLDHGYQKNTRFMMDYDPDREPPAMHGAEKFTTKWGELPENRYHQMKFPPVHSTLINLTEVEIQVPSGILLDMTRKAIRIPQANPALCAVLQVSKDNDNTWIPLRAPRTHPPKISINALQSVPYHMDSTFASTWSICVPLSWNESTDLPLTMTGTYRLKICNLGSVNECSEAIYPEQDLPTMMLLLIGAFCILTVCVLITLFIHFTWTRVRRERRRGFFLSNRSQPTSSSPSWFPAPVNPVPEDVLGEDPGTWESTGESCLFSTHVGGWNNLYAQDSTDQ